MTRYVPDFQILFDSESVSNSSFITPNEVSKQSIEQDWHGSSPQVTEDGTAIIPNTHLVEVKEIADFPDGAQYMVVGWDIAKGNERGSAKSWHANGWAWDYNGVHWVDKLRGKVTKKRCLGVYTCLDPARQGCRFSLRPLTKGKSKEQLVTSCPQCQTLLHYTPCGVRSWIIDSQENQTETWVQESTHYHAKPPWGKHVNRRIQNEMKNLILCNPDSTPMQLQRTTNVNAIGAPKNALQICPKFTNRSAIRHNQNVVLTEANAVSKMAKNTDAFIQMLKSANTDFPDWIRQSSFDYQSEIITMQSEYMCSCLNQMSIATNNQSGYITDAAHGFFENGLLLTTVGFVPIVGRWQPVLISWIGSNTAKCYKLHFSYFIRSVRDQVGVITDDHLSNVVDFSVAESTGFKEAFIEHAREALLEEILEGRHDTMLDASDHTISQQFSQATLEKRAAACLKGCLFHYQKNVIKVKRNATFVPVEEAERFAFLANKLLTCDEPTWQETLRIIRETFPMTKGWLDWWVDTRIAEKLFDCKRAMSAMRSNQLPSTTNAGESVHRQIYLACKGNNKSRRFNVIQGIHVLRLYDQGNEELAEGCRTGYSLSSGSAQRSRTLIEQYGTSRPREKKRAPEHFNDGRPIDNNKKLIKAQDHQVKANQLSGSVFLDGIRFFGKTHTYQSTAWQDNLCYFDSLVEVVYMTYVQDKSFWDDYLIYLQDLEDADALLFPLISLLELMTKRYQVYELATTVSGLQKDLIDIRNNAVAAYSMASIVQLGSLGASGEVWHRSICHIPYDKDKHNPFESTILTFQLCKGNHKTVPVIQQRSEFVLPIVTQGMPDEKRLAEVEVMKFLTSILEAKPGKQCMHKDCQRPSIILRIGLRLPKILLVEEQTSSVTHIARYVFSESFNIIALDNAVPKSSTRKKTKTCLYKMVGKILYNVTAKHYTALVRGISKPTVYCFDGMTKNPDLALQSVEGGMGYCLLENTKRVSSKNAAETLSKTTREIGSALYSLDSHDEAQMLFYKSAEDQLQSIGIALSYRQGSYQLFDTFADVPVTVVDMPDLASDEEDDMLSKAENCQYKKRQGLFHVGTGLSTRKHAKEPLDRSQSPSSVGPKRTCVGLQPEDPTALQEMLDQPAYRTFGSSHCEDTNDAGQNKRYTTSGSTTTDHEADGQLPLNPHGKVKPSFQIVAEPIGKPAAKEFVVDTSLPRRRHQ